MAITDASLRQSSPAWGQAVADRPSAVWSPGAGLQVPVGVRTVPTEQVLLLSVVLPAMAAAQRRMAVGFAVEDHIAQTLDEVHVVPGPQMAPGVWLVAVTDMAVLADLRATATDLKVWPDVFLVPVPRAGWSVWEGSGRVLVRLPEGTGFATSPEALPLFWSAAGAPEVTLYGGTLPSRVQVSSQAALPVGVEPALNAFDLRAGGNRTGIRRALPKGLGPFLLVVVAAVLVHLALLGLDVIALNRLASDRATDLRELLNVPDETDLDVALTQALAARQPADQGGMLTLLTRAFSAMDAQAGRVSVQNLKYSAENDAAVLTLEAPDLATLQAIETALSEAGLTVTAGAATTSDGSAEVQMTIRGGGP